MGEMKILVQKLIKNSTKIKQKWNNKSNKNCT